MLLLERAAFEKVEEHKSFDDEERYGTITTLRSFLIFENRMDCFVEMIIGSTGDASEKARIYVRFESDDMRKSWNRAFRKVNLICVGSFCIF